MATGKNPVLLSSSTLCVPYLVSPKRSFTFVKNCGFDGVEVHLNTRAINAHRALARTASKLGIGIIFRRWHHTPSFSSKFFTWLGVLPPVQAQPRTLFAQESRGISFHWQLVIPSSHWEERGDFPRTVVEPTNEGPPQRTMLFDTLRRNIKAEHIKVCLDPLRWIQYQCGALFPADSLELAAVATAGVTELIKQLEIIRLYDFGLPERVGNQLLQERRLFPGEGIFPIEQFLGEVKNRGWRGTIVWDISPMRIVANPWSCVARLKELPRLVREAGL